MLIMFMLALSLTGTFTKPVQAEFNTEPMIACGTYQALALKSDGTGWTWGANSIGQSLFYQA